MKALPGLRGLPLRLVARELWHALVEHNVADGAAALAFTLLFSLFPLLFFLVSVAAYLPLGEALEEGLGRISPLLPASSMQIIEDQLHSLLFRPRPHLLTISLAVAIYSASRGLDLFRKSLNLAHHVSEARPVWRTQWLAIWTTVLLATLVLLGLAMLALGGKAGFWLASQAGIAPVFALVWSWLRWPTTALVIMLAVSLAHGWLPDVDRRFRLITPGSAISTGLWLLATWGFSQYANHVTSFNVTYGSLGAAAVLLTWLFLSALVFIVGGELDAAIERASASERTRGAHRPEEAPVQADRVDYPAGVRRRQVAGWRIRAARLIRT